MCWLALLLIRIAETTTGATWSKIADEFALLTLGTFTGPAGMFRQTAELTKTQRGMLAKLSIAPPKKIIEASPAAHGVSVQASPAQESSTLSARRRAVPS